MGIFTKILEAVSDEQKNTLKLFGGEVIEERNIGVYDIALIYMIEYPFSNYTLGFQREGGDFTDIASQNSFIPRDLAMSDMKKIPPIIKGWLQEYGKMAIGSHNDKKTKIYKRVFERYGLNVTTDTAYGYEFIILSL